MRRAADELTIDELEAILQERYEQRKQVPVLEAERLKIMARLEEIDKSLARCGAAMSPRPAKKVGKRGPVVVASKPPKRTAGKRQKGVTQAVLAFIGSQPVRARDVAVALGKTKINVDARLLTIQLSKLAANGRVERCGRGLYRQAKAAAQSPATTGTVTQRLLHLLEKANGPVTTDVLYRAMPDVAPNYIFGLLNGLVKAKKITYTQGRYGLLSL